MGAGPRNANAPGQRGEAAVMGGDVGTSGENHTTPSQEAHAFLQALWGDEPPLDLELMLYRLPSKVATWHTTPKAAAVVAVKAAGRHNVYTGVGLQRDRPPKGERGKSDNVGAIAGLWADIDYQSPAHKAANLPPTEADALALLGELPTPTIVVHSGHGLQAWWLFREPWVFESEAERLDAADLSQRWQATIHAKAAAHGWEVDHTADIARVLRVPGTVNCKPDCEPVAVRLLSLDDGARYTRDDFEPYLADVPDSRGNGSKPDSPRQISIVLELPRAAAALARLSPTRADDYETWLEVGMALSELGDAGLPLWDDWSKQSTKYEPGACTAKWATFKPGHGLTLATLYYLAGQDSPDDGTHQLAGKRPGDSAAAVTRTKTPDSGPDEFARSLTDLGNGKRFAAMHQGRALYVSQWGWLLWDGRRWARDEDGGAMRLAVQVVKALYREASNADSEKERKAIADHARRSESVRNREAMLRSASAELALVARVGDFDRDPWLLSVNNGTIDLRTRDLRPHTPRDLITRLAPVTYNPDARHDVWTHFLEDATGEEAGAGELGSYLQRAAGYMLTGSTAEEVFFLLLGPAASGKSTFVEALQAALGDYAMSASFDTFLERRDVGAARPDIARLRGARLVSACEASATRRLAEQIVKRLVGGDTIAARELYREEFEFKPVLKLLLAANESPRISDTDSAIWRRLRRIPFERVVPEAQRDPGVKATLTGDPDALSAILAWAVTGCLAWQRDGLGYPNAVRAKTAELRASFDPLGEFFAEHCIFNKQLYTPTRELRQAYERWAQADGAKPISNREWGERLMARGCRADRETIHGKRVRVWRGIALGDPGGTDGTDGSLFPESSLREDVHRKVSGNCPSSVPSVPNAAPPGDDSEVF